MHKTILFTAPFTAAFAALAALVATPALAQAPAAPSTSRSVSTTDLDLGRPADRARLDRRIAAALETVCGSYADSVAFEEREIARCRADARGGVDAQLASLQSRRDRSITVAAATR